MTTKKTVHCPLSIARFGPLHRILSLFTFCFLILSATVAAQLLTVKEIMKEPSIAGTRVSGERLSPDGKWVVYLWNAEGRPAEDLYLVSSSGGDAKKLLSPGDLITKKEKEEKPDPLEYGVVVDDEFVKSRRNGIGNLRWSPDSSKILFTQSGDIFVLGLNDLAPKRITKTETSEFSADFLDNDRLLFSQSGNLFSINTKDGTLTQISKEANSSKNISIFGSSASKDGSMIAYAATDGSNQRPLFVPNYLPYYTAAPTVRRGWTKFKIYAAATDGSFENAIEVNLPEQEGEAYVAGLEWLADNKTLIVDRVDQTHKRRQIFAVTFKDGKSESFPVFEEKDDRWIGGPARILKAHPNDPGVFLFGTEIDTGYYHLFLAKTDVWKSSEGKPIGTSTRLTEGGWEINWADWSSEGDSVFFCSTKEGTAERTFSKLEVRKDGTVSQISKLGLESPEKGMISSPSFENGTLLFGFSKWNTPEELYSAINVDKNSTGTLAANRITNTTPQEFLTRKWNEPKFISFKARDEIMVPAKIYFPAGFDKKKKYPMVIFVHGAGYLQNVINGWNNYYREFMFNQLLSQKGYVVLDIDYRGSAGYGRDFRSGVYDFLGGKDYEDHIDGIDFMVREYNVDQKRIGVYGGSYGGFMAAMLVMRSPEKIKAAAALRPVMDWKNYYAANPFYTSQRLGDPKKNPEAYKRSSPISYADKLEKKILILHGILDDNVHVQDSIQLVEQLMRLDKTEFFELMLYPAERHSFERPSSWEDEYERILALFERELR